MKFNVEWGYYNGASGFVSQNQIVNDATITQANAPNDANNEDCTVANNGTCTLTRTSSRPYGFALTKGSATESTTMSVAGSTLVVTLRLTRNIQAS